MLYYCRISWLKNAPCSRACASSRRPRSAQLDDAHARRDSAPGDALHGTGPGTVDAGTSSGEEREVRRLLYSLDAIISLHLATEEELLSQVEDLPVQMA